MKLHLENNFDINACQIVENGLKQGETRESIPPCTDFYEVVIRKTAEILHDAEENLTHRDTCCQSHQKYKTDKQRLPMNAYFPCIFKSTVCHFSS